DTGPRRPFALCGFACGASGRRLQRVKPLLRAIDVLARAGLPVFVDSRRGAGAVDMAHAVGLAEGQAAVADVELVAVKGANGRTGGPVLLLVVLASVATADKAACRPRRNQLNGP